MRRRVEDMTGCIPLYLRCFTGCNESTFDDTWTNRFAKEKRVQRVYDHLWNFYKQLKKDQSLDQWIMEIDVLRSFLLGTNPHTDRYDHRYLFQDESGFGHVACGLARDCLVSAVRALDSDRHLVVDGRFLSNIKTTSNPSMRGFLIEQACLTYIRHSGLPLPSPLGVAKPDKVIYFDAGGERGAVASSSGEKCVLYIPRPFNYKSVDAILRHSTFAKNDHGQNVMSSVLLVPIQVTVSASHKPSPESFYPNHRIWLADIDAGVALKHAFVWLRRDHQDSISHQQQVRVTREQRIITPPYDEITVTFNSLSGDLHVNTSPPRLSPSSTSDSLAHLTPIPFYITSKVSYSHPSFYCVYGSEVVP